MLGILPGLVGTIQATEAVKLILGIGETLAGRFLIYDAMRMRFRELTLRKDPDCPVCGTHPTVTALIDYDQFCGIVPAPAPAAGGLVGHRHHADRAQGADGRRHHAVHPRRPRAERIPDQPHPRLGPDPAG